MIKPRFMGTPTHAQKAKELARCGYSIVHLGEAYGDGFEGQYRWESDDGRFQDHEVSFDEEQAFDHAWDDLCQQMKEEA